MTSGPSRLLIADYDPIRLGIRMALGAEVSVCAEATDAEQAIRLAMREQPDICLVGRHIPGDGIAAVRGICRAAPQAAVVLLSEGRDAEDLIECVRAGAIGYVPEPPDAKGLRTIVRAIAAHEAVVPRSMVLELMAELRGGGIGADALTGRETQVLGMLRRGHSTAAIARRLNIAPVTVRRHISELVRKLGVEDRSELATLRVGPQDQRIGQATGDHEADCGQVSPAEQLLCRSRKAASHRVDCGFDPA